MSINFAQPIRVYWPLLITKRIIQREMFSMLSAPVRTTLRPSFGQSIERVQLVFKHIFKVENLQNITINEGKETFNGITYQIPHSSSYESPDCTEL